MATESLVESVSETVAEVLTGGIPTALPALDPLAKEIFTTWTGVVRDGIGRDWKKIWPFSESVSGAFHWGAALGAQQGTIGDTVHSIVPGETSGFPGQDEAVNPQYVQKSVSLVRGEGNMFIPLDFLRLDKLDATVNSLIADITAGTARNVALSQIQSLYAHDTQKSYCIVGGVGTATSNYLVIQPKGGQARQFANGMHVDIYDATDSFVTKLNGNYQIVVDGVRYVPDLTNDSGGYGQITLKVKDGTDWATVFGTAVAAADVVVLAGSWDANHAVSPRAYGPNGPESWMLTTGSAFGIDVAVYQQFQSIVSDLGGVLTELVLNQLFGRYFKAYGYADMPDTLVMSMGTSLSYIENRSLSAPGFYVLRDQGDKFTMGEGFELGESPYTFNGQRVKWKVSAFMPSLSDATDSSVNGGRVWGLKTRDKNFQRLVPPPLGLAKSSPQFGREIEFLFGTTGPGGIFSPYHNSVGRKTKTMEAPFECYLQHVVKHIPGLLITSVKETI